MNPDNLSLMRPAQFTSTNSETSRYLVCGHSGRETEIPGGHCGLTRNYLLGNSAGGCRRCCRQSMYVGLAKSIGPCGMQRTNAARENLMLMIRGL